MEGRKGVRFPGGESGGKNKKVLAGTYYPRI